MSDASARRVERLPRGVWSATAIGMTAGAIGWFASGWLTRLTVSYTRLDQLTALLLGATIGGCVLGARDLRQRRRAVFGACAGALLGGTGALTGASLLAFAHGPIGPRSFVVERVALWMLACAGATLLLSGYDRTRRFGWLRERIMVAAVGGATAGAVFSLPGPTEVWQALACLWFGGALALAFSGPELWHADAVVEMVPPRGQRWHPLTTREWPLHEGVVLALGEAQLASVGGRVVIYPPAGGLVASGHTVRQPRYLDASGIIAVGRTRYRLQVLRQP